MGSTPVSRPRTPSKSSAHGVPAVPPIPVEEQQAPRSRRSSFSFLHRGKSIERLNSNRSVSGGKLSKKQNKEQELQRAREAAAIPMQPPKIPALLPQGQLQSFGGENGKSESRYAMSGQKGGFVRGRNNDLSRSNSHGVPIPPMPGSENSAYVDPYARTESMTNRGRYSYASSAVSTINSPRRVRRRKDPTPFNILVVGARNSGKTSFLEFLRASLALPARKQRPSRDDHMLEHHHNNPSRIISAHFQSHYLETEMDDGERVGLTLWDSEGLDKTMVDLQLRELSSFLESKFEDTFNEEQKVIRSPGVRDTHIHCVFLILDPLRLDANIAKAKALEHARSINGKSFPQQPASHILSGLDEELDLQVLRTLQGKTTVVPVISKADTITSEHMGQLKRAVWDSLKRANVDSLEALGLDVDGGDDSSSEDEMQPVLKVLTPQKGVPKHYKHDSKKLDERDEDNLLGSSDDPSTNGGLSPLTSHLDSASSSSDNSTAAKGTPRLTHSRQSSSTFPAAADSHASDTTIPYLPLSIISPDPIAAHEPGIGKVGRKFPWGFADPYNPEHCDFVRLKEAVFKDWRGELREASRELWYEGWRTSRLRGGRVAPNSGSAAAAAAMGVGVAR